MNYAIIILMNRNFSSPATILSIKQSGENNRSVTLIIPEEGLVYATLYGGPKSKLKSLVSPFNSGTIWLYRDEAKQSCKITDFDANKCHPEIHENLFKSFAASFGAEILIKSKCAGSPDQAFSLYNGLLDGMSFYDEKESRLGLVRFIWRYMGLLGSRPDTSECCQCGNSFLTGKLTPDRLKYKAIYSETDNGFVCQDCCPDLNKRFVFSMEAITYLAAISSLSPAEVRKIIIGEQAVTEIKDFCYAAIEQCCNTPLLSLQTGMGIL